MQSLHRRLERFADANLEYVVVGGYAGVLHGSSLVTNDLDICAVLSPENVQKLRSVLADLHPMHRMTHRKLSFRDHPTPTRPFQISEPIAASKEAVGREKDLLAVKELRAIKQGATRPERRPAERVILEVERDVPARCSRPPAFTRRRIPWERRRPAGFRLLRPSCPSH